MSNIKSITLNDESMLVFRGFRKLFHHTNSGISDDHREEFERIDKQYKEHVQSHAKPGYMPAISIEVSESFYDTWFHKMYNEFFHPHSRITKNEATELNDLYKNLHNCNDHPNFVGCYKFFYDN